MVQPCWIGYCHKLNFTRACCTPWGTSMLYLQPSLETATQLLRILEKHYESRCLQWAQVFPYPLGPVVL
uniref:Exosome complex component RRP42 n=1 Tax=Rhizophora mucronata TaxID=61149 RepID=A0A2P2K5I9_RHIMU